VEEYVAAQTKPKEPPSRLIIHDLARRNGNAEFAEDVRRGLSSNPKQLFPKYLYDSLGSRLFDAICHVDEYYPTRAENEILTRHADEIIAAVPDCRTLIELGSGSADKTRSIIEALLRHQAELLFIPVDISVSALEKSSRALLAAYPALRIEAYAADYLDGLAAMQPLPHGPALVLFLGSNIGNFEKADALDFLRAIRRMLRPGDALLLGADLRKDRATLEAAYNDALGVTRAFIVNELARINRELGGNFDLWSFGLRSVYNEEAGCVEVYLESLRPQLVTIEALEMSVTFAAGEWIHMEHSYKFDMRGLSEMGLQSGFGLEKTWLDSREMFSSNLFRARES
jgi:L-histidine N-alpha-methyltransferase